MRDSDVIIIGAGVIGLTLSYELSKKGYSVILLEKEKQYGTGVSSRNTETIHAGIYYTQGSLKASLCIRGKKLLYEHCEKYDVKYKKTGKIFVAVTDKEASRLEITKKQALFNGVDDMTDLDKKDLNRIEPFLNGTTGLLSPSSGVFDSHGFMKSLFHLGKDKGVMFAPNSPVVGAEILNGDISVETGGNEPTKVLSKIVINAAGLYSVGLSKKVFPDREIPNLFPVKGNYLRYSGKSPFSHLVYPSILPGVIEERVDAAPDIAGSLRFGPNIEKTEDLEDFNMEPNVVDNMVSGIRRYFPEIDISRLHPDCAGIRPKIYGPGDPVEDFRIEWADGVNWLDLWGIESPGLTASLAIAEYVHGLIKERNIL